MKITISNQITAVSEYEKTAKAFAEIFEEQFDSSNVPHVIAFTGLAGSGKDTSGEALMVSPMFVRESFADPIRKMLEAIGVPVAEIYREFGGARKNEPLPKFGNKSLRYLMQTLGTEWGRDLVSDSLWLDLTTERIKENTNNGLFTVITDLRFENEAQAVKKLGGVIVKIQKVCSSVTETENHDFYSHSSESGIPDNLIDATISNFFYDNPTTGKYVHMKNTILQVSSLLLLRK